MPWIFKRLTIAYKYKASDPHRELLGMKKMRRRIAAMAGAAGLCMLVAACGGGGGGGGGSTNATPPDDDGDGVANVSDCAPTDKSRWQVLSYQAVDVDSDAHPANVPGQICSGTSLPAGYFAAKVEDANVDCDDANASRWQLLSYAGVDLDGDGHRIASAGQMCAGNSLPAGYSAGAPSQIEQDCDDASSTTWRYTTVYADRDGDGVGSGKGSVMCIGASAASGYSLRGYDPLDDPMNSNSASVNNFDILPTLLSAP
jgi:hypothetical protein